MHGNDFELIETLSLAAMAAGIVAELIALVAAVGLFVVAKRIGAPMLHLAGAGVALIGLNGLLFRVFWVVAPRAVGFSDHIDVVYMSANGCNSCVELVGWSAVAIGVLAAGPQALSRRGPGSG